MKLRWFGIKQEMSNNLGPFSVSCSELSSDYAQPITGQVTEVTSPVIGQAWPELTTSKRQKTGSAPMMT